MNEMTLPTLSAPFTNPSPVTSWSTVVPLLLTPYSTTLPVESWILIPTMLTSLAPVATTGFITSDSAEALLVTAVVPAASQVKMCTTGPGRLAVPAPDAWTIEHDESVD